MLSKPRQSHLLLALFFAFLILDVLANHLLIQTHSAHAISSGREVTPCEVSFHLQIIPEYPNCTRVNR